MSDDELDELLTPLPGTTVRRDAIFAKTLPLLRPWRFGKLITAVGLIAVGFGAGWMMKPTPAPERIVETVIERVPVEVSSPAEPLAELTPDRMELEAERAGSAALFRQAGDAYLKANAIESAIRCYRQHLAEAGADGRTVNDDDTWLLTSIKHSKRTENDHANAGS